MYVITGATGNIGKRITEKLLANGKKVRAIARDSERLNHLDEKGAEKLAGDLADETFVIQAFEGAEAVFAIIPPILKAEDLREAQNRIGENIAEAIDASGIKYAVNLSSMGAHLSEGTGILLGSYDQEQRLNRIEGLNVVHLRPGYFMENFLGSIGKIMREGIFSSSLRGDISMPIVATKDIAEVASRYLLELNFRGKVVHDLLGERNLTMNEITRILGESIGKPELQYVQTPYEQVIDSMVSRGISPSVAEASVELSKKVNENPDIFDSNRTPEKTTGTSIEQFAKYFAELYHKS